MSLELSFERLIAAPPERVFDAFVAPDGQRAFYGRDDPGWVVESECELRVGGVWTVRFGPGPDQLYEHRHVFEAIEPPRRVVLTTTETRLDGSSFDTSMEFTFTPRDGGTLMRLLHSGFPTEALREEHGLGLPNAFERFARTLPERRSDART